MVGPRMLEVKSNFFQGSKALGFSFSSRAKRSTHPPPPALRRGIACDVAPRPSPETTKRGEGEARVHAPLAPRHASLARARNWCQSESLDAA